MSSQKNFTQHVDYDMLICLNQSLVRVDWVSERTYCKHCIQDVSWQTYPDGPGYYLIDSGKFISGSWCIDSPHQFQTIYDQSKLEFWAQACLYHPILQCKFFLQEATFKLQLYREELSEYLFKQTFDQVESSFLNVL